MIKKIDLTGHKIFIIAILASFLWHVFWLSAIGIKAAPDTKTRIKFSKVSFLGPIFERGTMQLSVEPKERSFLEKRYLKEFNKLPSDTATGHERERHIEDSGDEKMAYFIEKALGEEKPQPAVYDTE